MTDSVYTVGIVVDAHFGNRICDLARETPVWVVDTLVNRAAAEQRWRDDAARTRFQGVTTFKVNLSGTPNDWCSDILQAVDLHHGEQSHDPSYCSVVVIGTDLSAGLRSIFESYGFAEFSAEGHGFRASVAKSSV
jgi:hypothetical protein